MKKALCLLVLLVLIFLLACQKITSGITTTEEEAIDVNIVSASIHEGYVYKERLQIITSLSEANIIDKFFVENLHKEDFLSAKVLNGFFDNYVLLAGYVNVSFLDQNISDVNVIKKSNKITVQLSADFNMTAQALSNRANLSYVYFTVTVDKDVVDASTVLDVEFLPVHPEDQSSTYPFVNHTGFTNETKTENIYEFTELSYEGPIVKADSVESYNAIVSGISGSASLEELSHDGTFFDTHAYLFANYTYSGSESIVCVMGLKKEGSELQIVFSGNAPEQIESMQQNKRNKLFVIDVLKADIANITSFSFNSYNLYNGDHRTVINNNTISDTYQLITFELTGSKEGVTLPLNICRIGSTAELTETFQAWSQYGYVYYLVDYFPGDDFFINNEMILFPLTYRSSDLDVQVSEIRNYGSYFEIITTTDNTEFGLQTYGICNRVFILSIPKDQLSDDTVFVHSMIYLQDH